jgi:sigma-B regulation protein RsbU (phosphoserine phosphatase)
MRTLIRKLFPPVILSVLFLFAPSDQYATETHEYVVVFSHSGEFLNSESITNAYVSLVSSESPGDSSAADTAGPQGRVLTRLDIYEIIFGTLLSLIGLTLITLSLLRWKANDLSLISSGILCFLYGARTKAFQFLFDIPFPFWSYTHWFITYLIPIPAWLFIKQFLGKGWKSSIRRLLQVQIVFSITAISVSAYLGDPAAAMVGNNIIVVIGLLIVIANLFQPHLQRNRELKILKAGFLILALLALHANIAPWFTKGYQSLDLEWLGFIILIGCFGYAVACRIFQNEKELITISHELETARQIQSFILPGESVDVEGLQIAARYIPMASVAGDFYDFAKVDDKRLGILVADVSGHGVPASLISTMVKIAFASNISQASNPAEVLAGINQVLCGKLEADFVTAGYLFIDTSENIFKYAGAGHPPLFVWRGADQKIYEFREKGTILGQFQDAQYQNISFNLKADDRIFLYTDGAVETFNSAGDIFGFSRLKDLIRTHAKLPADQFADMIIRHLFSWSGKNSEQALDDDLTLIVADYKHDGS